MRTNQHFKFQDLNANQLWELRQQIVLNSVYVKDYENEFEFDPYSICNFFDDYIEYILDIAAEDGNGNLDMYEILKHYDNPDNLFDYYCGLTPECLCSIQYTPEWDSEDEEEYERYWNGIDPVDEDVT